MTSIYSIVSLFQPEQQGQAPFTRNWFYAQFITGFRNNRLHLRPEEAYLLGQGNAERGADGGDGVPEGDAVDDVVGEEAGVLQGEGAVAHHQLPNLLAPLVQDGPGAEVHLPLADAPGLHRRVQVPHLRTRIHLILLLLFEA